jgi:hypothetical protein
MQHVGYLMNSINTKTESAYDVQLLEKLSTYTWQGLGEVLFLEANCNHGKCSGVIKISKYSS